MIPEQEWVSVRLGDVQQSSFIYAYNHIEYVMQRRDAPLPKGITWDTEVYVLCIPDPRVTELEELRERLAKAEEDAKHWRMLKDYQRIEVQESTRDDRRR